MSDGIDVGRPRWYSSQAKRELLTRLGDSWRDVADAFHIPMHERKAFPYGDEPRSVYDWLESRGRLAELPAALLVVGRRDLADVLENDQFEPSILEKLWHRPRWVRVALGTGAALVIMLPFAVAGLFMSPGPAPQIAGPAGPTSSTAPVPSSTVPPTPSPTPDRSGTPSGGDSANPLVGTIAPTSPPPGCRPASVGTANVLINPDFRQLSGSGDAKVVMPSTSPNQVGQATAAAFWGLAAHSEGSTSTARLAISTCDPTQLMLDVATNGPDNGLVQVFDSKGLPNVRASVWIYVVRGAAGIGLALNGSKGLGTKVQVLRQWVLVQCPDPNQPPVVDYPKLELLIYSGSPTDAPDGAEFYVTEPSATTSYT